jgi:hypothetical protein
MSSSDNEGFRDYRSAAHVFIKVLQRNLIRRFLDSDTHSADDSSIVRCPSRLKWEQAKSRVDKSEESQDKRYSLHGSRTNDVTDSF